MANIPPHPSAAPRLLFAFAGFTLLAFCCAGAAPFSPPWWFERGVVATASPVSTNDYAAATQGQVKWMADRAMAELDDKLTGGAGAAVSNLLASFSGAGANDYAGINGGQLKAVAAPFYDRLRAAGWPCILPQGMTTNDLYPWATSSNPANDYAMVRDLLRSP